MQLANPEKNWKHEFASIDMFDFLLAENPEVEEKLRKIGGLEDQDFTFIKELIFGPLDGFHSGSQSGSQPGSQSGFRPGEMISKENWPYIGRGPEKSFLYQIISNKFSEVRRRVAKNFSQGGKNFSSKNFASKNFSFYD